MKLAGFVLFGTAAASSGSDPACQLIRMTYPGDYSGVDFIRIGEADDVGAHAAFRLDLQARVFR